MKPSTVNWINGLIILRLVAGLVILVLGPLILWIQPETGFLKGIADRMIELKLLFKDDSAKTMNAILNSIWMPWAFSLGAFFSLKYKKAIVFYAIVILDIGIALISSILPFLPILILILSFQKPTRAYFNLNNLKLT